MCPLINIALSVQPQLETLEGCQRGFLNRGIGADDKLFVQAVPLAGRKGRCAASLLPRWRGPSRLRCCRAATASATPPSRISRRAFLDPVLGPVALRAS